MQNFTEERFLIAILPRNVSKPPISSSLAQSDYDHESRPFDRITHPPQVHVSSPKNRWQQEAEEAFKFNLINFRASILRYAFKDSTDSIPVITPKDEVSMRACYTQLLPIPPETISVSIVGLILVEVVCSIAVLSGFLCFWHALVDHNRVVASIPEEAFEAGILLSKFAERLASMQMVFEHWIRAPVHWSPLPQPCLDMLSPSKIHDIQLDSESFSSDDSDEGYFHRSSAILTKYDIEQQRLRHRTVVRIRLLFVCHMCEKKLGNDQECPSCRHRRCKKCLAYPKGNSRTGFQRSIAPPLETLTTAKGSEKLHLDEIMVNSGKATRNTVLGDRQSSDSLPHQVDNIAEPANLSSPFDSTGEQPEVEEVSAAGHSGPIVERLDSITQNQPRKKLLFWCMNEIKATVRLVPIEIEQINELSLAPALINAFNDLRGLKRYFSLTCLHGATLIKYSMLVPDDRIVAPLGIAISVSRISRLENGYELENYSAVPSEHIKWVEKNMAYRFSRPSCSRIRPLIQYLPKLVQEWAESIPIEGCAICNVVAWSFARTTLWFTLIQIPPTIFAVRWLVGHHGDLQNSFEAEAILLTILGVFMVQRDRSKVFRGIGESV